MSMLKHIGNENIFKKIANFHECGNHFHFSGQARKGYDTKRHEQDMTLKDMTRHDPNFSFLNDILHMSRHVLTVRDNSNV